MSAQTEKKAERKSTPPSERKSKPPIGVNTSKLQGTFGSSVIEGIMDVSGQVAEAKIKTATRELGGEVESVKGNIDEIKLQRKASRRKLEDAVKRLEKLDDKLGETEKSATVAEAIAGGHVYAISEIREIVDGLKGVVPDMDKAVDEQNEEILKLQLESEYLEEKVDKLKECVKDAFRKFKDEIGKSIAKEKNERGEQYSDLREIVEGLMEQNRELAEQLEETKKLADDAMHDSDLAKAAASGALETVTSIQKTANGMSSDLHKMGREVERLSMAPSTSPDAAESYLGEASGVAKMPPAPVKAESKKEIEQMLNEIEIELGERIETISQLKEVSSALLEHHKLENVGEAETIAPVDFADYKGYAKLRDISKGRLSRLAALMTEMRMQKAELKVIYEATARLSRKTDLEMKVIPPREADKMAIEKTEELASITVKGDIERAIGELSKELDKQARKIEIIYDVLTEIVNTEGESE